MTREDLAWLTGFYEGEGTCGFYTAKTPTKRGYFTKKLTMAIGQNERAVLEKVRDLVGYGYVWTRKGGVHSCYGVEGTKAFLLLSTMLPLMKSNYKREQVESAIRRWQLRDSESRSNVRRFQH